MKKILFAYGTNLAVAKEAGHPQRAKLILNQLRIVVRAPEEVLASTVAAAQACPKKQENAPGEPSYGQGVPSCLHWQLPPNAVEIASFVRDEAKRQRRCFPIWNKPPINCESENRLGESLQGIH